MIKKFLNYLYSIRFFILICGFAFFYSIFKGHFFAENDPERTKNLIANLKEMYDPFGDLSSIGQFLLILLNNSITLFFSILLGLIFGIIPLFIIVTNGIVLGALMYVLESKSSLDLFFLSILPHGILEIPVLIIGSAMGVNLGKVVFDKIFHKKGDIKKELSTVLEFFWKIIIPLLAIAAAIEIFVTARILGV